MDVHKPSCRDAAIACAATDLIPEPERSHSSQVNTQHFARVGQPLSRNQKSSR